MINVKSYQFHNNSFVLPGKYGAGKKEMSRMFQNQDFWIGLGVGVLAGIFGYKLMVEREQQLLALQQPAAAAASATVPVAELQRQKEELEDMIAAQEAAQAK